MVHGQIFKSLIYLTIFLLLAILAVYSVIGFRRLQTLKTQLENNNLQFENGDFEKWNPDTGLKKQLKLLPYDKECEFPRNKLILAEQLISGNFGVVFKADAIGIIDKSTTSTVIVKMAKHKCYSKVLITELKIMIHIGKHLNIVNLLGACTGDKNKLIIIEYCRFGSIRDYMIKQKDCFVNQVTRDGLLNYDIKRTSEDRDHENEQHSGHLSEIHDNNDLQINSNGYFVETEPVWCSNYPVDYNNGNLRPLCTHDLMCWSFQVAQGMEYLASKNIIHGDLSTRNILLADDNIVKINNFASPKIMYSKKIQKKSKTVPLPVKWMAIESLRDQIFSTKSDVWSFGIVLWEIFSLAVTPYQSIKSYSDLLNCLDTGYRMEKPKYASFQLYDIMLDCWKTNPMTRPSFVDLAERIGDSLSNDSKSHYMNLNKDYIRMNTTRSFSTDDIYIFTRSTNTNSPSLSEINCNLPMKNNIELQNKDMDLKKTVHNNK